MRGRQGGRRRLWAAVAAGLLWGMAGIPPARAGGIPWVTPKQAAEALVYARYAQRAYQDELGPIERELDAELGAVQEQVREDALRTYLRGGGTLVPAPARGRFQAAVGRAEAAKAREGLVEQRRSFTGFEAVVYRHGDRYVLAYAGTDPASPGDWGADVGQAAGKMPKQYGQAVEYAREVTDRYGRSNVVLTGHSLGGGLAQYAALRLGLTAYTFNPAGLIGGAWDLFVRHLADKVFEGVGPSTNAVVRHFVTRIPTTRGAAPADPVSVLGAQFGAVYAVPVDDRLPRPPPLVIPVFSITGAAAQAAAAADYLIETVKVSVEYHSIATMIEALERVAQGRGPVAVLHTAFVIDVSGSMEGDKIEKAKACVERTCRVLATQGQAGAAAYTAGLVAFSGSARVVAAGGSSPAGVARAAQGLTAGGGTNIHAGVEAGLAALDEAGPGGKLMVLLSDGVGDEPSTELLGRLHAAGVRVYTIGFGDPGDLDEQLLRRIARRTGGAYFHAADPSALEDVFRRVSHTASGDLVAEVRALIDQGEIKRLGVLEVPAAVVAVLLDLAWQGSTVELVITDPDGVRVDSTYPGYAVERTPTTEFAAIANPKPGRWTVDAFGKDIPHGPEPFRFLASVSRPPAPPGPASARELAEALEKALNEGNVNQALALFAAGYADDAGNDRSALARYYAQNIEKFAGVSLAVVAEGPGTAEVRVETPGMPPYRVRWGLTADANGWRIERSELVGVEL
ncbi:vWA domain-containing protein [Deferrisoma sp.]